MRGTRTGEEGGALTAESGSPVVPGVVRGGGATAGGVRGAWMVEIVSPAAAARAGSLLAANNSGRDEETGTEEGGEVGGYGWAATSAPETRRRGATSSAAMAGTPPLDADEDASGAPKESVSGADMLPVSLELVLMWIM